jgi:hypothetical protein
MSNDTDRIDPICVEGVMRPYDTKIIFRVNRPLTDTSNSTGTTPQIARGQFF